MKMVLLDPVYLLKIWVPNSARTELIMEDYLSIKCAYQEKIYLIDFLMCLPTVNSLLLSVTKEADSSKLLIDCYLEDFALPP